MRNHNQWRKKKKCACVWENRGLKNRLVSFVKCEFQQDIPPYILRQGQDVTKFWVLENKKNFNIYDAHGNGCFEYDIPSAKVEVACLMDDPNGVWTNRGSSAVVCLVALLDTKEVVMYHGSRQYFDITDDALMFGRGEVFPLDPTFPIRSKNQWGKSKDVTQMQMNHLYELIQHRIAQENVVNLFTRKVISETLPFPSILGPMIANYLYPNEFGLFWRNFIAISAMHRLFVIQSTNC
jgi:hypothetical protein